MRFLLVFYADTEEWMGLPAAEREAAIAEIGRWYGDRAPACVIVEGRRLAPGAKASS